MTFTYGIYISNVSYGSDGVYNFTMGNLTCHMTKTCRDNAPLLIPTKVIGCVKTRKFGYGVFKMENLLKLFCKNMLCLTIIF